MASGMMSSQLMRMSVKKRSGNLEHVSFDKILKRLQNLCWPVDAKPIYKGTKSQTGLDVDVSKIVASICSSIVNEITTTRLDELAADKAASMTIDHPDYAILAARISVSNLQKQTLMSVLDTYEKMSSILNNEFMENVRKHHETYQGMIDYDRDFNFDYFGFKTLEKLYLVKIDDVVVERPQHMYLRVAICLWGSDFDRVRKTYDALSRRKFTHASPTLFNAGLKRQQLASCFLTSVEDSLAGIFDSMSKCAQLSKYGGGIGLSISDIRGKGSKIRATNGESDGIVPMLKVYDATCAYANQSGRRKGSFAVYLEPWHPDIVDFLMMKRNQGDESIRARNLFYAMWIDDLFMKRVENDAEWSLFDPNECPGLTEAYGDEFESLYLKYETDGRAKRVVKARDVWNTAIATQIETGTPYIVNKDAINRKNAQKHAGTIKCSNLCVSGDTNILTSTGYHQIENLEGKQVKVWNGHEFSETIVHKTGINQKLLTVTFDDGTELKCTPYHKFYIETGCRPADKSRAVEIRAKDLQKKDKIIRFDLPTIVEGTSMRSAKEAYTAGFFSADGTIDFKSKNYSHGISIKRDDKKKALYERAEILQSWDQKDRTIFVVSNTIDKFDVPINSSLSDKIHWLEGYFDGDGCVVRTDGIENIQAVNTSKDFLNDIRLMLQTIGVRSKVKFMRPERTVSMPDGRGGYAEYDAKGQWRLNIDSSGVRRLVILSFSPARLQITGGRESKTGWNKFVRVVSVDDYGEHEDTYCFNEPKRHMGIFNGVLGGNCSEIVEFTSKSEVAVCVIGSIVLKTFVKNGKFDFDDLHKSVKILAKNLDRMIDIMFYPIEEAKNSNVLRRPIGVGVQGLNDVFFKLRLPFDSDEARNLNKKIFEYIYHAAVEASVELAEIHGPHPTFEGSPASEGTLQYHMWNVVPETTELDWKKLERRVRESGTRNSLHTALMPTASTAQICGSVEAFEPITSNLYSRKTLAGEFPVVNSYLVRDLIERGMWDQYRKNQILTHNGNIQRIIGIPADVKALYKTAWDVSMKSVIDMAADRGPFVDQTQSMNLFLAKPTLKSVTSMLFYAWKKDLKTIMYYLRSLPASEAIKVTVDECISCSG